METIELFNIAPNGLKVDVVRLKEVPNADGSDTEYQVYFLEYDYEGYEEEYIGRIDLILGDLWFPDEKKKGKISFRALKLLATWVEENLEEID